MRNLTKVFKALSDPNRVRILKMLEVRPLCVCELTSALNLATSTVSKHLSLLREAELILDEKDGKWVYYKLNETVPHAYGQTILPAMQSWLNENDSVQADRRKILETCREEACKIYVK